MAPPCPYMTLLLALDMELAAVFCAPPYGPPYGCCCMPGWPAPAPNMVELLAEA